MNKQIEYIRIVEEVATGLVNSVNKTYSVIYPIAQVETVKVNGQEYGQYSFSGNSVILDDAPTAGAVLITYNYISNIEYNDNAGWIINETLEGEVNGANQVFTSFYPISLIDELRVNGVASVAYTVLGNSILMNVAPTTGVITIDYFRKDFGVIDEQRDEYYTKKEVRDLIYGSISQDDTSTVYPTTLVDTAIKSALSKIDTFIKDTSRNISFTINVPSCNLTPITNSITTATLSKTSPIPNEGRIITSLGSIIDYSLVSGDVVTLSNYQSLPTTNDTDVTAYVGYKLPRNIRRIVGVYGYLALENAGNIGNFLTGGASYLVSGGFIFIKSEGIAMIEIELRTKADSDDAIIFIEKDDITVIIDYALARLYRERESDKYTLAEPAALQAIKDYKTKIRKKRSVNSNQVMKTVPLGAIITARRIRR